MQKFIHFAHKHQLINTFLIIFLLVSGVFFGGDYYISNSEIKTTGSNLAYSTIKLDLDKVEVVTSPEDREKGLMNRTSLCAKCGMLFVFEEEKSLSFWMKDTLISLDIIFVRENGKIANIAENAEINNTTKKYNSTVPVKYVLETNAGFSEQNKLQSGTYLDIDWLKTRN